MNKAYFFQTPQTSKLKQYNNLVGRILLPAGNYVIQAKAFLISLESRFNYQEIFKAKLTCSQKSDEALMAIFPRMPGSYSLYDPPRPKFADEVPDNGGKEAVVFLQIAVKIDTPMYADLSIFSVNDLSIMLFSASILAYQVEELEILDTFSPDGDLHFRREDLGLAMESYAGIVKVKM